MKHKWERWFNVDNPYQYRDDNIRVLGFKSYGSYLRSALWKDIRQRALAREPVGICDKCKKQPPTQVHHRSYDPATMRGDSLDSLSRLCRRCHRRAERPGDKWQGRYDRYKSAGDYMMQRKHPRERTLARLRKKAVKDSGR